MNEPIERLALGAALMTMVACGTGGEATTSTATTTSTTESTTSTPAAPTTTALPEPITSEGATVIPLADREQARLVLTGGPDWLTEGFGSIWVKVDSGDVRRIDPVGNSIQAEIPVSDELCQGIGISPEAIWTCTREVDQPTNVARIDPANNEVAASIEVGKSTDQGRLVFASGRIWVLNATGDQIMGIDTATNAVGPPIELGTRCTDLAAAGDVIWATCPIEGFVIRIDPGGEVTRGPVTLENARQIAAAEYVFVSFSGGIAQLDAETLEVLALYEGSLGLAGSIWAADDAVWVRRQPEPLLTRIDPATQTVVEVIEAEGPFSGGDVLVAFDSIWATAFDDNFLVRLASG